jgi:uncharacterized protein YjbI with pentapeptide repeats
MADINRWQLSCQNRVANIWYNQDYTVYGLNPAAGGQQAGDNNIVYVQELGGDNIALRCHAYVNYSEITAYASMRQDYNGTYQVQFQAPWSGSWITQPSGDETFQAIPTGDGFFALYSPTFGRYVQISGGANTKAGNCNALAGTAGDIDHAARFTANGLDHPGVFDFIQLGKNASGMSFTSVSLAGRDLSGDINLSRCDLRRATSFSGCNLTGANLRQARLGGLHVAGLQISGADCTGADFYRCDFTSYTPGTNPPVLAQANLTGAVVPGSLAGVNLAGAVLAEANLTGADLSGPATDLAGANFSGHGVSYFDAAYPLGSGIDGFNLSNPADQIIAFDYESKGELDHLVCYRPGTGMVRIVQKKADGTFAQVFGQQGIGGYDVANGADRIIAYDYAGTGNLDHLVCYRPGTGTVYIVQKVSDADDPSAFHAVYTQSGIGGFTMTDAADRIIAYDYAGTGKLDHLVCYRPGAGTVSIVRKVSDQNTSDAFRAAYSQSGIGGYDLGSSADQVIAYDYGGTGNLDHLVCYRPGHRAIFIVKKVSGDNSPSAFQYVYHQGDPGNGIGGYFLADPADRVIAYDYDGTGKLDHLLCYRPGTVTGIIWILKKVSNDDRPDAFAPAYQGGGIGGYDLTVPIDQIIAYDLDGTGKLDGVICYRPGWGTIWFIRHKAAGPATLTRCKLGQANVSGVNLAGLNLTTVTLAGANLSFSTLAGATIAGIDLTGANLASTDFTGLDLTTVRFSVPLRRSTDRKNPTTFAGCTLPYAVIGLDWSCLDLTNATINGLPPDMDLTGLNATGLTWSDANLNKYILDGANFSNATIDGAQFSYAKLRWKTSAANFAGASLMGAVFTGADLNQASFTGATLGGDAPNTAAVFSGAYISNCDFTEASMLGVNFAGATLIGGNKLSGATDLQQTDFSNAYLPDANFTGAHLEGAKFDGACMIGCILNGAFLTPTEKGAVAASLVGTWLQAASFEGANLGNADLSEAIISNTRGIVQVRYYGENNKLTSWETMRYQAGDFPAPASFNDDTICPNLIKYGANAASRATMAEMMTPSRPPGTQWSPGQVPGLDRSN